MFGRAGGRVLGVAAMGLVAGTSGGCPSTPTLEACLAQVEGGGPALDRCAAIAKARPQGVLTMAKALLERGELPLLEAWTESLEDPIDEAHARIALGKLQARREDYDGAVETFTRTASSLREEGPLALVAEALHGAGRARYLQSRLVEALAFETEAHRAALEASPSPVLVKTYAGLFAMLGGVADWRAVEALVEAADRDPSMASPSAQALVRNAEGVMWKTRGRPARARFSLEAALRAAVAAERPAFERSIRFNLLEVLLRLGASPEEVDQLFPRELGGAEEPGSASDHYFDSLLLEARGELDAALVRAREGLTEDVVTSWRFDLELQVGRLLEASERPEEAAAAYRRALAEARRLRDGAEDPLAVVAALNEGHREALERLAALAVRSGRVDEAWRAAEAAKGRTFHEAMVRARLDVGADALGSASARISGLERAFASLESRELDPSSVTAALDALPVSVGVLAYLEVPGGLLRLWARRGERRAEQIASADGALDPGLERLLARPDDREAAAELGDRLLPPSSWLDGLGTLYVIPDGRLGRLPFALLERDGHRLIERHAIAYVPNLGYLSDALEPPREGASEPGRRGVQVLADGQLPGAVREAKAVAARFAVEPRIGDAVTREALRGAAQVGLLHVASHGTLHRTGGRLLLADGPLGVADVLADRIGPALVVLASCESGARAGPDLWGSIAAAFLAAGSRSVVASLWSVPDEATERFVRRFYALGGAQQPRIALARAQREALAAGHPAESWGPFVVMGR